MLEELKAILPQPSETNQAEQPVVQMPSLARLGLFLSGKARSGPTSKKAKLLERELASADQAEVQRDVIPLPADFLQYSREYGKGTVGVGIYSWTIHSVFHPSYPQFCEGFVWRKASFRISSGNADLPLGLFPEHGGLLPFGHRDDVYFTWKTDGEPDAWHVVVIWLYQPGGYQVFNMGFTEFIVALLTRKIRVAGYNSAWDPATDISFSSHVPGG